MCLQRKKLIIFEREKTEIQIISHHNTTPSYKYITIPIPTSSSSSSLLQIIKYFIKKVNVNDFERITKKLREEETEMRWFSFPKLRTGRLATKTASDYA